MPTRAVVIHGIMTWEDSSGGVPPMTPPGVPTHPIYYPPGIWGGGNEPFPTPPIYIPRPPLGIWGGANQPFPTPPIANAPGVGPNPNPPGFGMHPSHPIYYPPHIWGGGNEGFPTPPIYLPPNLPPIPPNVGLPPGGSPIPPAVNVPIDGKLVFVPGYGWMFIPNSAGATEPPTEPEPEK